MKKIAFFVNSLIKAGPVNVVYDIVSHIDRTRYEPYIYVLRENVEFRSVLARFEDLGIKVIFFNFSFIQMELKTKKCVEIIEKQLKRDNINIVHSHTYNSAVILSKCSENIKKIITFHNICNEDFPRQKGFFLGNYMFIRYMRAIKKFDKKIGISEIVSNFYRKKTKDDSVFTIYNGVDCDKFIIPSEIERESLREKFGVQTKTVYVTVGTISKLKNIVHIIDTIKKLNDNTKVFFFIGTGPLLRKCKKIAEGYENIIFTGYQMNIREYLSIADFSIAASKTEGFGLAALEVIMSGITLIYSDCKAFKELFSEDKILKEYMFTLDEENSLLDKIKQSKKIENIEKTISEYRQKFDSKIMSNKYQQIYGEV